MNEPEARQFGRRRPLVIASLILLALIITGAVGTLIFRNIRQSQKAERYYAYGVQFLEKGDSAKAYSFLKEALKRSGPRPDYLEDAARAALGVGQSLEAMSLARDAWQLGRKNDMLLRIMAVASQTEGSSLKAPQLETMFRELPSVQQTPELQGDLQVWLGQNQPALDLWLQAFSKTPSPRLARKIAEGYLVQEKTKEALAFLEKQREQQKLDAEGYLVLARLYASDYDFSKAVALATQSAKSDPQLENSLLQKAIYLVFLEKLDDALTQLAELESRPNTNREPAAIWQTRLWQAYLLWRLNQPDALNRLQEKIAQEPPRSAQEGSLLFVKGLRFKLKNDPQALDTFTKAHQLIPKQPMVGLLCAMENLQAGNLTRAIEYCQEVPGIPSRWPQLRYTLAQALARDQQTEAAIKVLYDMHRHGVFSPQSLALFRDLTAKAGLTDAASASQTLLNRYFGGGAEMQINQTLGAMQQADLGKPAEILDLLNSRHPAGSRPDLGIAKAMLNNGQFEAALKIGESGGSPEDVWAAVSGFANLGLQRLEQAEAAFARAVITNSNPDLLLLYGSVLVRNGKLAEAKRQFETVLQSFPDRADARSGLALIAFLQNQREEFLKQAQAVLTARPNLSLPLFLQALDHLRSGNPARAQQLCEQLLKNQPDHRDARQLRAAVFAMRGLSREAEQDLLALLKQTPSPDIQIQLARLYIAQGKGESALKLLEMRIPSDSAAVSRARKLLHFQALLLLKRLPDAERLLAELRPMMLPAPYTVAAATLEEVQGRPDKAIDLLKDHLQDREAAFQWAALVLRQGKDETVLESLRRHSYSMHQWTALAGLAEKQHLYPAATRFYEQALKLNPTNVMLLNNWAWNAIQTPGFDADAVVAASQRALEAMPGHVAVLDTYTETLLRSGRWKACVEVLDAHAPLVKTNAVLLCLLGQAHEALRQPGQAVTAFEQCLAEGGQGTNWPARLPRQTIEDRIRQLKQETR